MPIEILVTVLRHPLTLLLSLATVLAVVAAGCGSGGTETRVAAGLSPQTLSQSAQSSADETSAQFTFSMTMTAPGLPEAISFSGSGAFDSASERAAMTFDMSAFVKLMSLGLGGGSGAPDLGDPDDWKLEIVQDGEVVYLHLPMLASRLPDGKSWVRIDAAEAARLEGFDLEQLKQFGSSDPREMLKFLEAVGGDIETVGTEEVGGVPTTHYRATIDLRRYADLFPPDQQDQAASLFDSLLEQTGLGAMPVDVWIDDEQRVRRFELDMSATQPGTTEGFEATLTMEMFGYGEPIAVEIPPADQVVDASALTPNTP